MSFVTVQGASSATFRAPPTDGSLTLIEMFDYNALNSPKHPLFRYESADGGSLHDILWADAIPAIHKAARLVRTAASDSTSSSRVVAILASMGTLNQNLTL
jgi:acyl-CoA synthetase (AMP-forming)/AMP-acid ligase II